ncbi:hypothetical protein Q5O89_16815 [Peribacillus frigoritolerans]|nr:hypothetical protein [Peribacillus frigoritolerans]
MKDNNLELLLETISALCEFGCIYSNLGDCLVVQLADGTKVELTVNKKIN